MNKKDKEKLKIFDIKFSKDKPLKNIKDVKQNKC